MLYPGSGAPLLGGLQAGSDVYLWLIPGPCCEPAAFPVQSHQTNHTGDLREYEAGAVAAAAAAVKISAVDSAD